ncbi:N-acetylmuramoyl-L-alanine amidase [candidate division WOR-3 bacterium]|nr:N-acetylmuramoyl-L-alanine amidase [candidate division WOR-3 bacterium]
MLVCLDAGHGGSDPGAVGKSGTKESDVNLAVVQKAAQRLMARGHQVILTRDSDARVTLESRTSKANNAQAGVFVSVHCNSDGPSARGFETWYWHTSARGRGLAQAILDQAAERFPDLRNRGIKASAPGNNSLHVLRKTNMPSALLECAFISNPAEESLLRSAAAQARFAEAIARGIDRWRGV